MKPSARRRPCKDEDVTSFSNFSYEYRVRFIKGGQPTQQRVCHKAFIALFGITNRHVQTVKAASAKTDLKAFERRLTEVISGHQPAANFWRVILAIVAICTFLGAWAWLFDPLTSQESLAHSLWNHPFFSISGTLLFLLFLFGIHKRVVAASIIASRCRTFLSEYNMSCDDNGKLILKPRPAP